MIWVTSSSGAEAPAVMPSVAMPSSWSHGMSAACCTSSAFGQPARSATSTSRSEFELLGAPTTISPSQRAAMAFTASWRLVVA